MGLRNRLCESRPTDLPHELGSDRNGLLLVHANAHRARTSSLYFAEFGAHFLFSKRASASRNVQSMILHRLDSVRVRFILLLSLAVSISAT